MAASRKPEEEPRDATGKELAALSRAYAALRTAARRTSPGDPVLGRFLSMDSLQVGAAMIQWMLYQGHIEHRIATPGSPKRRSILEPAGAVIASSSFFSLTEMGVVFADLLHTHGLAGLADDSGRRSTAKWLGRLVPRYEPDSRVFTWGAWLVKHFKQPAPSQELILIAAQEQAWPPRFDDPLTHGGGIKPKVHLKETIRNLNLHQIHRMVHFKGDGSGRRIGWELC